MAVYRLFSGAIHRQDVPGGNWSKLTAEQANAILATLPDTLQEFGNSAGRELVEFLTEFKIDGRIFGDSILARDWEDAERQVQELRASFRVVGMLEERGAICL